MQCVVKNKVSLYARKRFVSVKNQEGAFWFKIFGKKLHSAEKPKAGTLWELPSTLARMKICGLVRDSNPRSPASQASENPV